jgi:hypothetical protein
MGDHTTAGEAAVNLIDGRRVSLRRLGAEDTDAVLALYEQLPERDRYLRFFTTHPANLDQFARRLTEPDSGWCAIGAFDAGRLIGVANYVVADDDPHVAEGSHISASPRMPTFSASRSNCPTRSRPSPAIADSAAVIIHRAAIKLAGARSS